MVEPSTQRASQTRLFDAFARALNAHFATPFTVAELGSGSGHLTRAILAACPVRRYVALDTSPDTHAVAREQIGSSTYPIAYEVVDLARAGWAERIYPIDALITWQLPPEVRHRTRLPRLLWQAHHAIASGGLLLFCNRYGDPDGDAETSSAVARNEQLDLIRRVGFVDVTCHMDEDGRALYSARRT